MKSYKIFITTAFIASTLALSGCTGHQTQTLQTSTTESNNVSTTSSSETTNYNLEVYSDDYLQIILDNISSEKITFSVTSKLKNNPISVNISDVALDGLVPEEKVQVWGEDSFIELNAGETKNLCYYAHFNYTEHKTLSVNINAFNEHTSFDDIDIVNFDLGHSANLEYEEPTAKLLFDNNSLSITYVGADDAGIRLRLNNKKNEYVNISFDRPIKINAQEMDEIFTALTIPANSSMDYYFDIKMYNPDYTPADIKNFSCSGYTFKGVTLTEFSISSDIEVTPYNKKEVTNTATTEKKIESSPVESSPETEKYYNISTHLTKYDLEGYEGNWKYKGIPLCPDDVEWIDTNWNTNGTVEVDAIYKKMAHLLEGISFNRYTDYAEILIGYIPDTKDDFVPYVENASRFICTKNPIPSFMRALEELDCVNGTFDYDSGKYGTYDITISDTAKCAEDLQISEEMLGYCLSMLSIIAPEITFDNNSCHIMYEYQ